MWRPTEDQDSLSQINNNQPTEEKQTIFTPKRPLPQKSCTSARISVQTSKCSAGNQPTTDRTKYDVVDNAFITENTITVSFDWSRHLWKDSLRTWRVCYHDAPGYILGSGNEQRSLFPFLKRSLPFLTVDSAIGNQAFRHDRCINFPGLSDNKANNTFLNSVRENDVEAKVKFMLKIMESARITSY